VAPKGEGQRQEQRARSGPTYHTADKHVLHGTLLALMERVKRGASAKRAEPTLETALMNSPLTLTSASQTQYTDWSPPHGQDLVYASRCNSGSAAWWPLLTELVPRRPGAATRSRQGRPLYRKPPKTTPEPQRGDIDYGHPPAEKHDGRRGRRHERSRFYRVKLASPETHNS
jgi:hypothetical protein